MTGSYAAEVADVRPGDDLDWRALAAYLQTHMDGLGALGEIKQFPNGSANLTYRLDFAGRRLVVRRPPFGRIPEGAHDMKREYRALSRLWRSYDRAPRAFLFCDDHTVAGADFLVMEYREGQVVWNDVPPNMAHHRNAAQRIGLAVVDALADLHGVNPDQAGLIDLGRPEGFVDRQLAGWRKRWEATSYADRIPVVADIFDQLIARQPRSPEPAILHNDFKVDNCQFDPSNPDRVISVFDWDMATIGDPLTDLGTLLNYWPDGAVPADGVPGIEALGLPSRDEVVAHYAARTGRVLQRRDVAWYEAFGCWKTAVILQQLFVRHLRGESSDDRMTARGEQVVRIADRALALAETLGR